MREIQGDKYKLAGIEVYQKGTLVDVFAKFCGISENIEDILADKPKQNVPREPAKPGTMGEILEKMTPVPRRYTLPSLSIDDIINAVVGKRDLQNPVNDELRIIDNRGVIEDLGPEKLALILIEMGEARKKVLEEGLHAFVPSEGRTGMKFYGSYHRSAPAP